MLFRVIIIAFRTEATSTTTPTDRTRCSTRLWDGTERGVSRDDSVANALHTDALTVYNPTVIFFNRADSSFVGGVDNISRALGSTSCVSVDLH